MSQKQAQETQQRSMMTQIILLQPKADTTDEELEVVFKAACEMQKHIPCLLSVSTGENQSNHHRGLTHGIILHFEDETHLRDAMKHATYLKMFERFKGLCEQIIIFDLPETLPVSVVFQTTPSLNTEAPKQRGKSRPPAKPASKPPSVAQQATPPMRELLRKYGGRPIDPRIIKIIMEQLEVDERDVVPGASIVEDLNADSLGLVELFMSFEQVFNIDIPDEDAEQLMTVEEVQVYLLSKGAL